jgi:hypothetical protein
MKLRALKSGAFLFVLLGVEAVHATDAGVAPGDKAVTVAAVTLDIVQNGRKAGSTKVPPGRSVDIIEVRDGRAKVAAAPFLSGWVAFSDLKTVAAAPSPTLEEPAEDAGHAPAPTGRQPEAQAQSTRQQTSRIDIKETKTSKEIVAEGKSKCRGMEHYVSFQPTVTRGSDLEGKEAILRFYLITMQEDKGKAESSGRRNGMRRTSYEPAVRRLKDVVLPPDRAAIPPFWHNHIEGQCSCCRDLRHGELVGWYAELLDGDKVLSKTQSSLDAKASEALESSLAQGAL